MKVRGAVFETAGSPLVIEDLEMDGDPGPGRVLIRYKASGVCHSDLSKMKSTSSKTAVFGHEGSGVIEAVGEGVEGLEVGDKVIASFRASCGQCFHCLRGENPHCEWGGGEKRYKLRERRYFRANGESIAADLGTFSEAAVIPQQFVVKVETDLPFEHLALLGCGVTTGFGAAVNTAGITPGSTVAIIGCGGVGQSAVQGAKAAGASTIIAIDTVQSKLDFALSHGATHAFLATRETDIVQAVRALTSGRGTDFTLEVTGIGDILLKAIEMTRKRGIIVMVGLKSKQVELPVYEMALTEKQLRGSLYGSAITAIDFPRLIRYAELGELDLESMVSNVIKLDRINDAFEAMEAGEVIRTVISYE